MAPEQHEIEVTLLVCSQAPRQVIERLEGVQTLGVMLLQAASDQALRDIYFDTNPSIHGGRPLDATPALQGRASSLRQRGFSLRLRQHDEKWLLCLKRRGEPQGLAVKRLEIEGPPDDGALRRRIAAVAAIPEIVGLRAGSDPVAALTAAGFIVIQERRTQRRTRAVRTASGKPVATMAVDSVDYEIAGASLWHHEVEVEARGAAESVWLDDLARDLLETFPRELRPWRPSKLRTGLALQALAERVGVAGLTGPEGDLLPQAYAMLLRQLQRG